MLRTLLLELSNSPRLARWMTSNAAGRRVSKRFVAGEELTDALKVARVCNENGMKASLDHLGENVASEEAARRAQHAYLEIFDRIAAEKLDANVSLKLTQLGLDLNQSLCEELLGEIVARAEQYNSFVRIDMEGSAYTQRTVEICMRARARSAAVGTVLQSYLYRTEQDARDLLAAGCRIRLCKGAYKEPPSVAFQKKSDVDENYVKVMQLLLPSGTYHGIATHDENMIGRTKTFAFEKGIGKDQFEFQMLYGIRNDLQTQLVREGYGMRVYIPYGHDWFPYFMRRLAERPANVLFFVKNLFR